MKKFDIKCYHLFIIFLSLFLFFTLNIKAKTYPGHSFVISSEFNYSDGSLFLNHHNWNTNYIEITTSDYEINNYSISGLIIYYLEQIKVDQYFPLFYHEFLSHPTHVFFSYRNTKNTNNNVRNFSQITKWMDENYSDEYASETSFLLGGTIYIFNDLGLYLSIQNSKDSEKGSGYDNTLLLKYESKQDTTQWIYSTGIDTYFNNNINIFFSYSYGESKAEGEETGSDFFQNYSANVIEKIRKDIFFIGLRGISKYSGDEIHSDFFTFGISFDYGKARSTRNGSIEYSIFSDSEYQGSYSWNDTELDFYFGYLPYDIAEIDIGMIIGNHKYETDTSIYKYNSIMDTLSPYVNFDFAFMYNIRIGCKLTHSAIDIERKYKYKTGDVEILYDTGTAYDIVLRCSIFI